MTIIDQKSMQCRHNPRSDDDINSKLEETGNTAELETRDAEKTRMLRRVAHDLRNPISGILSASELLLEDLPDAHEEHVALLQAIQSSDRSILRLIDELMGIPTSNRNPRRHGRRSGYPYGAGPRAGYSEAGAEDDPGYSSEKPQDC